ncbi:hypothetical protein GCM10027360_24160 [Amycolatopsis echigonensis]
MASHADSRWPAPLFSTVPTRRDRHDLADLPRRTTTTREERPADHPCLTAVLMTSLISAGAARTDHHAKRAA